MNINDMPWRTSSYSAGSEHGNCVEVAPLTTHTGVRDTKDLPRGHLEITSASWTALLATLKI